MLEVLEPEPGHILLRGEADVHHLDALYAALAERVAQGATELLVDLSELELLDTAGLQLLLSLQKQLGPSRCRFAGAREGVARFFTRAGLPGLASGKP